MQKYDPKKIESKWQKTWEEQGLYKTPEDATKKNKMYILPQFPYPSASGLHVGHAEVYTACDIYARYQRMLGKKVLQVIGWDSFGLPAENYAIKTNIHPKINTDKAIDNFRQQIKSLGISVDWDREVAAHNPDYYKWTQWFFLLMYKRGLAYRKEQSVNWCDSCKTVLANEQVITQVKNLKSKVINQEEVNVCERCGTEVVMREMEQWFLKITDYADRLIEDLDKVDWPEETKERQRNWIGKSQGALVKFEIRNSKFGIEVFTTRPDTLFGATYMVLAPENEIINKIKTEIKNWKKVEKYIKQTSKKTELDRQTQKEKTGVELEGVKAVNPVNGEEIPIFVADYVLASYGTGAIMAVPAHDERDFEFAKKYNLEIREVVAKHIGGNDPKAERRDAVAGVVKKGDKILVLYNKKFDCYRLPSGGYKKGEEAEDVIKREMLEETGYSDFVIKDYLGMIESNNYLVDKQVQRQKFHKGFLIELSSDKKDATAFEEHEDYEMDWYLKDEAVKKLETYGGGEEEFVKRAFDESLKCFTGEGTTINSEFINELSTQEAKEKMIQWLEEKRVGKRQVQYKLHDWSVSRQRFWGAPIPMIFSQEERDKKRKYVLVHGYKGRPDKNFFPWLKKELENRGHTVECPELPNTMNPNISEQVTFLRDRVEFDENTVIIAHSLAGSVVPKLLEDLPVKVTKVITVDSNIEKKRDYAKCDFGWKYDFEKIKQNVKEFTYMVDTRHEYVPLDYAEEVVKKLDARLVKVRPNNVHFKSEIEESILEESIVTGLQPIPEEDLPILLPDDVDFKPTGQSPLMYSEKFQKGVEEKYGKGWKREVDTLDTFMCSSWYYYRYLDPHNDKVFASRKQIELWMGSREDASLPVEARKGVGGVDFYLGGEEHVNGHLLYSRFFTKVLYDAGYIDFDEPFAKHRHQGLILGEDHHKMSKRWGNVINPTDVVNKFGADTLRMYEMFMGPLEQTKPWDTNGVRGIRRFLDKVWALQDKIETGKNKKLETGNSKFGNLLHKTIKKITEDIKEMHFNTAIAKMMELVNEMQKEDAVSREHFGILLKLLSPFAPHICEELWNILGNEKSITLESWPAFDPKKIIEEKITLVLQVNGKVRANIEVDADIGEEEAKELALKNERIVKWLKGKEPKKVIYVKGKLINLVV